MRRHKRNTPKLMLVATSLLIVVLAALIELELLDIMYNVLMACLILLLIVILIIESVAANRGK